MDMAKSFALQTSHNLRRRCECQAVLNLTLETKESSLKKRRIIHAPCCFVKALELIRLLVNFINQRRWIVWIFLLPCTLYFCLLRLITVVCGRHPAYLFLAGNVNQSRS